jgi:prepilin-type N-terminal cleavage/methylation domain-containing protein
MKRSRHYKGGFTLIEILVAASIGSVLGVGLLVYSSFATRLISGNMATNHSHDTVRASVERMMSDLHGAASSLRLVNFNGTAYADTVPTATTAQDVYSGQFLSTRANAVRFFRFGGGPYKVVGDSAGGSPVPATATTLQFEFGPLQGGQLPYIPSVGDRMQLPLLSREFTVSAVPSPPTTSNTKGTVTFTSATGFILYTSGTTPAGVTNPITTANFYETVGYSVWNNQLRYHKNFPPTAAGDTEIVRDNVTSSKPFALLFPTATSAFTDNLNLRVSLESYDLYYGNRLFRNSTTTLQAVLPSRTQPPTLNSN